MTLWRYADILRTLESDPESVARKRLSVGRMLQDAKWSWRKPADFRQVATVGMADAFGGTSDIRPSYRKCRKWPEASLCDRQLLHCERVLRRLRHRL